MSKFDSNVKIGFECKNSIFGPSSKVKIGFECQNAIFDPNSNVKIGFRMSKIDIRSEFECRKTKSRKRKAKNEKQTNFTFNQISGNEKQTNFTLLKKKNPLIDFVCFDLSHLNIMLN